MRRQKGWIGYCRLDHKKLLKEWKKVDWTTGGTSEPKEETRDVHGKIIQKW
jgi:hypothetical protein